MTNSTPGLPNSKHYKWALIALLWLICFFNYADRQALSAVFPLLKTRFGFTTEELGLIGAAFTWVYALAAPFAGQTADRRSRKGLILGGLMAWSIITGFTALCGRVWQFVLVRGAEGLGETFYFPASMSMIGAYHAPETRSRAMSLHQTSVYAGTIGGSAFAGWLAMRCGWSAPFLMLGAAGCVLAVALVRLLHEPVRAGAADAGAAGRTATTYASAALDREDSAHSTGLTDPTCTQTGPLGQRPAGDPSAANAGPATIGVFLAELVRTPAALLLVASFFGANFVALVFLTWMPTFLKEKFGLSLAASGLEATVYTQLASLVGAVAGGWLADRWRARLAGGRMLTQAVGALAGGPFIFLCGFTRDRALLVIAMTLFGLAKGLYDANIWAALYDVVAPARRATAVGMMNMVGWLGGGLGAYAVGAAVTRLHWSMSRAIESTALIYVGVATLLVVAALAFAPADVRRSASAPATV